MRVTSLIVLAVVVLGGMMVLPVHATDFPTNWINTNYTARMIVNITENSGRNLTAYPILLNVTYSSSMRTDFGDIHFYLWNRTGDDSQIRISHGIDGRVSSSYADVWVNVSHIQNLTQSYLVMYYGGAAVYSNLTNVFDFFDDFESGISRWSGNPDNVCTGAALGTCWLRAQWPQAPIAGFSQIPKEYGWNASFYLRGNEHTPSNPTLFRIYNNTGLVANHSLSMEIGHNVVAQNSLENLDSQSSFINTNQTSIPSNTWLRFDASCNQTEWLTLSLSNGGFNTYVVSNDTPVCNLLPTNVSIFHFGDPSNTGLDHIIIRRQRTPNPTVAILSGQQNVSDTAFVRTCSQVGDLPVITFYMRDEETRAQQNGSIEAQFQLFGTNSFNQSIAPMNVSFNFTGGSVYQICRSNTTDVLYINTTTFRYFNGTDHPSRSYYLTQYNLGLTNQTINLYLLRLALGIRADLKAVDSFSSPQDNVVFDVQRFFAEQNAFVTVAMARTNPNGETTTFLRENEIPYRIVALSGNTVLSTFPNVFITNKGNGYESLQFVVTTATFKNFYDVLNNMQASCTFTNATKVLRCGVRDLTNSGVLSSAVMTAWVNTTLSGLRQVCSQTIIGPINSTESSVSCTLNYINSTLKYTFVVNTADGNQFLASGGYIDLRTGTLYGIQGVFVTFIVFLMMALIGVWNPAVSLIMGGVGLATTYWIGLLSIGPTSLIGILFVIAVYAWKMKT